MAVTLVDDATFFVPGPLPGSNEIIGAALTNRHKYSRMKNLWEREIGWSAKLAKIKPPLTAVTLHCLWVEPNRRRDKSNVRGAVKWIEDALVECGVLMGDGWKHIEGFRDEFRVDVKNPGVYVTLVQP